MHALYRRWRELADSYDPPRALIGEVNLDPDRAARYTRPDELHQAFAFGFLAAPWDAAAWRDVGEELLAARVPGGGAVTWVVENHDVVRTPTRYAPGGVARARAALLAVLGLPGGAYLYQGQELGLPEVDVPEAARQDPAWARSGHSRDGCRVPVPWRRDPAGTLRLLPGRRRRRRGCRCPTAGARSRSRPPRPTRRRRCTCAARRWRCGAGCTPRVCSARTTTSTGRSTATAAARRPAAARFALVVAMGDEAVPLPAGDVLLASAPLDGGRLPADAAAWVRARM